MSRIEVGGEDVFYARHRADADEGSVVFIHGAGGTHRHWGHQLQALAGASLYAPDLPGHGRSGGEAYKSISGYVAFLLDFLDAVGLARTTLVGHSMGGAIAQEFALTHAPRVDGLILVGTGARLRVVPSFLEGLLNDFESTVERMLGYAYADNAPPELVELGRQDWLESSPSVLHGDFLACDGFDAMDRLPEIRCPTLVVCGEQDQLTPPKYSQFLLGRIDGATLAVIPGAGHMVMLEQPEQVSRAMEGFLKMRTAP